MICWSGFADLTFAGSAGLALERALEQAQTEAYQDLREAWVIEDRHIAFSIDSETPHAQLEGTRRILAALVLEAVAGEVAIETANPGDRWVRRAAVPSVSKEITIGEGDDDTRQTIRTEAS
jgi:hypothetical protein